MTYRYQANVIRVIDGDTIEVEITKAVDLGFYMAYTARFPVILRLYGIDTPEVVGKDKAAGLVSKQWLMNRLPPGASLEVETIKDKDKYRRFLAKLYDGQGVGSINEQMLALELGAAYLGGKRA